jgi:hypothetical protein
VFERLPRGDEPRDRDAEPEGDGTKRHQLDGFQRGQTVGTEEHFG